MLENPLQISEEVDKLRAELETSKFSQKANVDLLEKREAELKELRKKFASEKDAWQRQVVVCES